MAVGLIVRGLAAAGSGLKAAGKLLKKKKPQARKATQKEYDKKLASRGKMTDQNNKERMDKLTKPSRIKMKSVATKKTKNY